MRHPLVLIVTFASLIAPAASGQAIPAQPADTSSRAEVEAFLRTAKVTRGRLLGTGVTLPLRLTLTDGTVTRDGVFKTIDEHKTGMTQLSTGSEVDFKDSWKYEVAAYELDKLLSVGMVPVTVERRHDNRTGSLQLWIHGAMTEAERARKKLSPPDPEIWNRAMYKVRVFDNLIFNFDRNLGNLLIGPGWELYMIDHTRAFKIFGDLRRPEGMTRFSVSLMEGLKKLDRAKVTSACGRYLTGPEIDAVFERRSKILELYSRAVLEKGDRATYP
jgi:hypothetical protein